MATFKHIKIRQKAQPLTIITDLRNMRTLQAALLRGDPEVTLVCRPLTKKQEARLRVPFPLDYDHTLPFTVSFSEYFKPFRKVKYQKTNTIKALRLDESTWDGFGLEWVKIIGQGGYGIATLWEAVFENGIRKKIVIKLPLKASSNMADELSWHLRYKGASHIVQPIDMKECVRDVRNQLNGLGIPPVKVIGNELKPDTFGGLILEYAEHGSLLEMMTKAAYYDIYFSNKVLWEIWECLVKGVASVAYQPAMVARGQPTLLDELLSTDNIEPLRHLEISHDVHFDLEECNILIAEDPKHSYKPIFKLHDFGSAFSHRMRDCWGTWKKWDYWNSRHHPKKDRFLPEKVTDEWDSVDLMNLPPVTRFQGEDLSRGNSMAGRYGCWTNIFLIARVMQSIITHLSCTHPCNCKPCVSLDGKKIANSYGWRLHDPIYAERSEMEIRNEIIQCMNEKPADRPDLISLLMAIARRKKKGFDETDEEIRDFWEGFWGPSEQQQKQQQQQHQFGSQINGIASGRKPPDRACKRQRAVQGVTVEEETPRSREAVAPPRKKIKISPPESPQRLAAGDPVALRLEALKRKRMGDKEQYPTNDTGPLQCHAANSPSFVHTRQNGSHGPKAYSMDINGDGKDKSGGESSGLPKEPPEPVILRFPVVYDSTSSIVDESMHEAPPPSPPNLFNSQTVRRDFNASASCFEPILSMFWRRQHPPPQPQPQPPVEPPHWRVPGFGNVTSFFNNFLDGRTPAEPYPKTASMMSGIIMTDHEQQRAQQETQSSEFFRILNSNLPWPSLRLKRKMSGVVRTGDMQNHQAIENLILRNTRLESTVLQDSTLMSWKSPWHGGGGGKDTMARPCISTWANSGPGLFNKTCYRTLMSQDDASDPRSRWLGRDNSFLAPGPMDLD